MTEVSVVFITTGSEEEASNIGRTLVEEKLVACANIVPRIRSIYWWKGEVCDNQEYLLMMKTRSSLLASLEERVLELHSYEVPEIISLPVTGGLGDYLSWVLESTRKD